MSSFSAAFLPVNHADEFTHLHADGFAVIISDGCGENESAVLFTAKRLN